MEVIRRYDAVFGIAILPPPLMTDDLHLQGVFGIGSSILPDHLDRGHGNEDDDHRRGERPGDLQRRMAVNRGRIRLIRTGSEPDHDVDEADLNYGKHGNPPPEYHPEEAAEVFAQFGGGGKRGLRERTLASCKAEEQGCRGQHSKLLRPSVAASIHVLTAHPLCRRRPTPGNPPQLDAGTAAGQTPAAAR